MEELADAIEDAQYVNAIATQEEGPRPVLAWDKPTDEELQEWKKPGHSEFDQLLSSPIGFFLFSSFVKQTEYPRMCFCETMIRIFRIQSKSSRLEKLYRVGIDFLGIHQEDPPLQEGDKFVWDECPKREIDEYDLCLENWEEATDLLSDYPLCRDSPVGITKPLLDQLLEVLEHAKGIYELRNPNKPIPETFRKSAAKLQSEHFDEETTPPPTRGVTRSESAQPQLNYRQVDTSVFLTARNLLLTQLKKEFWDDFLDSPEYNRLINFLWYQDRKVVYDDFVTMRVLGRGGFGLVTACKKGTSGKLYAMKIMNKKRIKLKKSEPLAVNEQNALAAVESKFVINLKYSFQSKDEIYLILDLMTGGDLGFHLQQRGRFTKRETLYYSARILLGLQALHDQKYVYRDLKPENCLLAEDGRVKLTDLGLATKITPKLSGAAGTRGYWAPEMLRRDKDGHRLNYDHTVDWFSFGVLIVEFITGSNPFRSKRAVTFGLERGKANEQKAIDCATMEMEPLLDFEDKQAEDLCRRLLVKDPKTRLGKNGSTEIMNHLYYKSSYNDFWDSITTDRKKPPFIPAKDVNAASQSEIGNFAEDKTLQETVLTSTDEQFYKNWDWTNPRAFASEVIEFLIYERVTGEPLLPNVQQNGCCCNIS